MGSPPPQDPYGRAEPYPGYASMHDGYYRRQQQAAAEAAQGAAWQPNLRNWGLPEAAPGLSPADQELYNATRRKLRSKALALGGLFLIVLIGVALEIASKFI